MPQVFISGSRSLARLPEAFCQSIDRICEQGFGVLVGDSERGGRRAYPRLPALVAGCAIPGRSRVHRADAARA